MDGKIDGGPAFPVTPTMAGAGQWGYAYPGMTLRDWFAGQALAGLTSAHNQDGEWTGGMAMGSPADEAYRIADAMLAERVRKEAPRCLVR